jgi:hypothetical protein
VSLRKFLESKEREDIIVEDIEVANILSVLDDREIQAVHLLYLNETYQTYSIELVILIELIDPVGEGFSF